MQHVTVALTGNPNCGKTTLFNALTGAHQRVGNWPGVTVERMEGEYTRDQRRYAVVDLPGIYSLSAFSIDETIARDHILRSRPDVVVNILDAANLERNLYLTTQLLEMRVPVVVALNMMDIARQRRLVIEVEHLARHLDCPVVPVVASRGQGLDKLRDAIAEVAAGRHTPNVRVAYDSEVEEVLAPLAERLAPAARARGLNERWVAVKLLEGDPLAGEMADEDCREFVADRTRHVERHVGEAIDVVLADGRYGFIHGLARDVIRRDSAVRRTVTQAVDRVLLNRLLAIPMFLGVMYGLFWMTIHVGGPFVDFFDVLGGTVFVDGFRALLESWGAPELLIAVLADGLGGGIQMVATFIPPILFIFLGLSVLEDSGYMARAAFVMDRLLRGIGLPGKAFLPMLVGFGCNVPGVLATRTLENPRDRIMTVLINPFMSCGGRLPVYAVFATAFFPSRGGTVVFALYLIGIVLGILTGVLLKRTLLRGEASTFVMELPPYHVPTLGGIAHHTWHKLKSFLVRAGRVILIAAVLFSLLNAIGTDGSFGADNAEDSVLSAVGRSVTPVLAPLGVEDDNWPATVGLLAGVFAKEAVIGTLDALYTQIATAETHARQASTGQAPPAEAPFDFWGGVVDAFRAVPEGFRQVGSGTDPEAAAQSVSLGEGTAGSMRRHFRNHHAAFAYLLFVLLYAPCIATVAAICRETRLAWGLFALGYSTLLAWVVATLYYQIATFALHPADSAMWIGIAAAIVVAFCVVMRLASRPPAPAATERSPASRDGEAGERSVASRDGEGGGRQRRRRRRGRE